MRWRGMNFARLALLLLLAAAASAAHLRGGSGVTDSKQRDLAGPFGGCNYAHILAALRFQSHANAPPVYCAGPINDGPGFTDPLEGGSTGTVGNLYLGGAVKFLSSTGEWKDLPKLNPQLTPTQFKPFYEVKSGTSVPRPRIGHEVFQGSTYTVVQGQCIAVCFSGWEELDKPGGNVVNWKWFTSSSPPATNCAIFQTKQCA
ncbi:hypothetical protein JKP88DRAFT_248839 [Tribonema minus]|uniref:Uncharacterized protein n=1 Tax=Tribonema minus TaxID=303371 RepID=A0A835YVD6_9STRA|nr:hypothetical protein JKP88DRAFT_248839 [Tribonema minus]